MILFSVVGNEARRKYTLFLGTGNTLVLGILAGLFGLLEWVPVVDTEVYAFHHALYTSPEVVQLKKIVVVWTMAVLGVARFFFPGHRTNQMDAYLLFLCLTLGAFLALSANDLITLYLGLEIQALASYVLITLQKNGFAGEAGLKYFLTGLASSALIVLGGALVVFVFRVQNFSLLHQVSWGDLPPLEAGAGCVGVVLIVSGLLVKLGVAPFHAWIGDVYQGAFLPVVLYLATVQKLVTFFLLLRVLFYAFGSFFGLLQAYLLGIAILSLIWGVVLALSATKIRRFLAYSSITPMGFVLLGTSLDPGLSGTLALLYFGVYILLTFGAWLMLCAKITREYRRRPGQAFLQVSPLENMSDLSLFTRNQPLLSLALHLNLLSMAGVPPLLGFLPKASVFLHLWVEILSPGAFTGTKALLLVAWVVALVSSVCAATYYLKMVQTHLNSLELKVYQVSLSTPLWVRVWMGYLLILNLLGLLGLGGVEAWTQWGLVFFSV